MKSSEDAPISLGHLADLILVGHFASGKSTVAKQLADRVGCQVIEVGDIVRSSAKAAGEPVYRHAEKVLASSNPLTFAYQTIERIKSIQGAVVVVGIRTPDELSLIRKARPSLVIGLDASPAVRRVRWEERQANGTRIAEVPWGERDAGERSWGLDEVMASADAIVNADRSLRTVVDSVERKWIRLSLRIILGGLEWNVLESTY